MSFDAGIRRGENVQRDMIAVQIGPPLRTVVVATPGYWDAHGRPNHPRDLLGHPCITYRNHGSGTLMPWGLEKNGHALRLQVRGPRVCNSSDLAVAAVRAGCGVGWTTEEDVMHDVAGGRLEQVVDNWLQPYPGALLYHPRCRQVPSSLQALIGYLRQ